MASGQLAIQRTLNAALMSARRKNPAFSLRAFSNKLDMSPSAVSEILNGKRRISRKIAERIVRRLYLDPKEASAILKLFPKSLKAGDETEPPPQYMEISADQFHVISTWYHFAILALSEIKGTKGDPEWIAARLGIRVAEAQGAIERMERLGMIVRTRSGTIQPTRTNLTTPDEITNLALRKAHAENLELARRSLERDAIDERDFTAMTMAIDTKKLPVAKKMIREFRDKLCDYLETGEKTEVYKMCMQLIPLSYQASAPAKDSPKVSEECPSPKPVLKKEIRS